MIRIDRSYPKHPNRRFTVGVLNNGIVILALALVSTRLASSAERTERFDREPAWDAHNNRPTQPPVKVRQDFGYSATSHSGGKTGEVGGFIQPAAEPAYYGKPIAELNLEAPIEASGTMICPDRSFHLLLGFYNKDSLKEWRTPNSLVLRLNGRGDYSYMYIEYATSRWRAGGNNPATYSGVAESEAAGKPLKLHTWSMKYDPKGNEGKGVITATVDGESGVCNLDAGHRQDGATFNRFGLLNIMKSYDGGGEVWLEDLTINGERQDFSQDPKWEGVNNRRNYETMGVRPRFDFGFSDTQFAGGAGKGELGGAFFRGDCRYPDKLAWYGDRIGPVGLEKPLRAKGKICLKRGVSDSGVLLGFFDSKESTMVNPAQDTGLPKRFFGISTDTPSRDGFALSAAYRFDKDARGSLYPDPPLYLMPDGKSHDWEFKYDPAGAGGLGEMTLTLDGRAVTKILGEGQKAAGAQFDRFGIITPWVDGNSQSLYFDDLTYTVSQEP